MDMVYGVIGKECAVVRRLDDTYLTCSRWNKAAGGAGYVVGEEVTIQWSMHQVYQGVVVFANGKQFYNMKSVAFGYRNTIVCCAVPVSRQKKQPLPRPRSPRYHQYHGGQYEF